MSPECQVPKKEGGQTVICSRASFGRIQNVSKKRRARTEGAGSLHRAMVSKQLVHPSQSSPIPRGIAERRPDQSPYTHFPPLSYPLTPLPTQLSWESFVLYIHTPSFTKHNSRYAKRSPQAYHPPKFPPAAGRPYSRRRRASTEGRTRTRPSGAQGSPARPARP